MSTPNSPPRAPDHPPSIMDIEASGFGLGSYPIEIGIVMPEGRAWCSLVRPEADWQHWDPNAAAMHGITREQLQLYGRSPTEIADTLNEWLHGEVIYSDAWAHDFTWLSKLYDAAERTPHFRLENLRLLLSDDEAASWHELKRQVASTLALERHRASADARLLQTTLMALRQAEAA